MDVISGTKATETCPHDDDVHIYRLNRFRRQLLATFRATAGGRECLVKEPVNCDDFASRAALILLTKPPTLNSDFHQRHVGGASQRLTSLFKALGLGYGVRGLPL